MTPEAHVPFADLSDVAIDPTNDLEASTSLEVASKGISEEEEEEEYGPLFKLGDDADLKVIDAISHRNVISRAENYGDQLVKLIGDDGNVGSSDDEVAATTEPYFFTNEINVNPDPSDTSRYAYNRYD